MILRPHEIVDLPTPSGGTMRVHLLSPAAEGPFPAVMLYSEIYQVTNPIRRMAAILAGHGYLVAIPEVYHDYEQPGSVLAYDPAGTDRGNALKIAKPVAAFDADTRRMITYLKAHPRFSGKLGALGVCLGGHLAYRAALEPDVAAAACCYATDIHSATLGLNRSDDSLQRADELTAEMLFIWGRQDPHVPFAGREHIRGRLEQVGATYQWFEVNAAHAFLRDEGPRFDPELFIAALGWMLDLFGRTLRSQPAG